MESTTKEILKQAPVRAALAALIGIVFAFIAPCARIPDGHGVDVAAALIFGIAMLIFARQTAARRRELQDTVYLELNKLRRLYHISKNLVGDSTRFRPWFLEIHGNLHMYLAAFEGGSLVDYSQNNPGFRRLSYHIYTAPELETAKEKSLYDDLLKTTGVIAEARQRIKELVTTRMSLADWSWLLLSASAAALTCLALSDGSASGRFSCGLVLGVILGGLDYVWHLDRMEFELKDLASRYVRNISKLEYRRERS